MSTFRSLLRAARRGRHPVEVAPGVVVRPEHLRLGPERRASGFVGLGEEQRFPDRYEARFGPGTVVGDPVQHVLRAAAEAWRFPLRPVEFLVVLPSDLVHVTRARVDELRAGLVAHGMNPESTIQIEEA